jgi:hypothetical protein
MVGDLELDRLIQQTSSVEHSLIGEAKGIVFTSLSQEEIKGQSWMQVEIAEAYAPENRRTAEGSFE